MLEAEFGLVATFAVFAGILSVEAEHSDDLTTMQRQSSEEGGRSQGRGSEGRREGCWMRTSKGGRVLMGVKAGEREEKRGRRGEYKEKAGEGPAKVRGKR